ncbi:ArsR/SmtB family transcription factor [Agrobacterium pusense]|uniref:ArsR/SmtB family transcription factor n=2 Tax=Agrobacterium pusense TaxID=648995 RepID=UPI003FD200D0
METMNSEITRATNILAAVANPKRLVILSLLTAREFAVGELAKEVDLSQSALSQHLAKLRSAALVSSRRHAQTIYYRCQSETVAALLDLVLPLTSQSKLSSSNASDHSQQL